jgi:outer membrane protein TolC
MTLGFDLVRWVGFVVMLACPGVIQAQSAPVLSDTLLHRLTQEALAANPGLRSRTALALAAGTRVRAAGALPDPVLEVGVMDLVLPDLAFKRDDFTEVDVQLSQEFPWPGMLGARRATQRAEARARGAEVTARAREIVVRTAELYYRLRYVVAARATVERQRALLESAAEISTTRYAIGRLSQADPLQARVALARLETEDAELRAEEAELRAELRALRGVVGAESLAVEPIRPGEVLAHAAWVRDTSGAAGQAVGPEPLESHPRIAARAAELDAARHRVRMEVLGARPDFTVTVRYGARPIAADFFSAFVGLRLPLWAGRKQQRLADAARAEADGAQAALEEERAVLAAELRTARARVASGEERLRLLVERVVPAAQATVEAGLRSYRVGQTEFLTVLAAEDALYRAELDAARVAAEHLVHLVVLERLLAPGEAS